MANGPTFSRPPVVEVALGVQFEPLEELNIRTMALYWEAVRDRYPKWDQLPPLAQAFESFERPVGRPLGVRVSLGGVPGPARSVFEDDSGFHLIQFQPDRFHYNWRKYADDDIVYPRYSELRERFATEYGAFLRFLAAGGAGEVVPTQCEVTYVNHLEEGHGWDHHGQLGNVLAGFTGEHSDDFLGEAEGVDLTMRYLIPGDDGEPCGRLHVQVRPVFRVADEKPMLKLDLTARTVAANGAPDTILSDLDRGHHFLVNAFRSLTTEKMHDMWGLQR